MPMPQQGIYALHGSNDARVHSDTADSFNKQIDRLESKSVELKSSERESKSELLLETTSATEPIAVSYVLAKRLERDSTQR
jgi:hypothetical protein